MEGSEIVQKSEYQCRDCECWVSNANTRCSECESRHDANNQQRRRYAEAAMAALLIADVEDVRRHDAKLANFSFCIADAMLAEQKKRESAESAS